MIEKIISYLLSVGGFCVDGSSKGPLLNQMGGAEMLNNWVGGTWGTDGLQLVGSEASWASGDHTD